MHILFVDESGTPPKPGQAVPRYFVVAGVIIPETVWHQTRDAVIGLKARRRIRGELKWRYFAPGNDDADNPMRGMAPADRDAVRSDVYQVITRNRLVTVAAVCSGAAAYRQRWIEKQDDVYHLTYKTVSERFQYYLQDISRPARRMEYGIVVGDHRGAADDKRLRGLHQKLLHATGRYISTYANLIEGLFLEPSHLSIGIQLADMVAGAVWRKYEREHGRWFDAVAPSLRRGPAGQVDGYGIIKVPKREWE